MKSLNKDHEFIRIASKGEIEQDAFTIMGGSTKRESEDTIGRFGSGLKYSIATLLSKGIQFDVFSGNTAIEFTTISRSFRGQMFDMIYINDAETNFSTSMGPDWEIYDAVRDIYANAVDEGLVSFDTVNHIDAKEGETHFYIKITEEVEELIDNIEKYFSFFRNDVLLEHNGKKVYGSAGHLIIYKQGFKIYEDKNQKSLFNYDFPNIRINESRHLASIYDARWDVKKLVLKHPNKKVADAIINHADEIGEDGNSDMWEFNIDWDTYSTVSDDWEEYFDGKVLMPMEASEFYSSHGYSDSQARPVSRVPKSLVGSLGDKVSSVSRVSDKCQYDYAEAKMNSGDYQTMLLLKGLKITHDLDDDIEIKKVKFNNSSIKASVDQNYGKKIILIDADLWENDKEVKKKFFQMVPILGTKINIGSISHVDALSEFIVDNYVQTDELKKKRYRKFN